MRLYAKDAETVYRYVLRVPPIAHTAMIPHWKTCLRKYWNKKDTKKESGKYG
jgi:hypothetical protein